MKTILKILIILLLFQDFIYEKFYMFSYFDELITILTFIFVLLFIILRKKEIRLSKYDVVSFSALILYFIVGLISNYKFGIVEINKSYLSLFLTVKGYLLYFLFRVISKSCKINYKIFKPIVKIIRVVMYGLVIVALLNIPFNFLDTSVVRYGFKTISLGFTHPTELAFFSICSMCIVMLYNAFDNNIRGNKDILILTSILVFFSGRSKAIAFLAIFIILYKFMDYFKEIKLTQVILLTPIALYIALPRITSELIEGARGALYVAGLKIAQSNFPLGSGFGTFGSHISRVDYSPLYYTYGLNTTFGLTPEMPIFITDTYWAMVLGETGFIGMILIFITLSFIFVQFYFSEINKWMKLSCLGLILYTLISSIAEPIFSSNKSAILFIIFAMFRTIIEFEKTESLK